MSKETTDKEVMKLRNISTNYEFDIGKDYSIYFNIYRDFERKNNKPEFEFSLECMENYLSFDQTESLIKVVGEETLRISKINPNKYDINKRS